MFATQPRPEDVEDLLFGQSALLVRCRLGALSATNAEGDRFAKAATLNP
jgi:hypothetical protein